jgi:hypothetical protein
MIIELGTVTELTQDDDVAFGLDHLHFRIL